MADKYSIVDNETGTSGSSNILTANRADHPLAQARTLSVRYFLSNMVGMGGNKEFFEKPAPFRISVEALDEGVNLGEVSALA